jgi:hypothetical protein
MARLRLVHWNAAEAAERAAQLRRLGHAVEHEGLDPRTLREIRADPPDAVVIDLTRLPSQGRDIGLAVRYYKDTRRLPIVCLGGDPAKAAKVAARLPDAIYARWEEAGAAIERALTDPPPVVAEPKSLLDGYSGTPLPAKLGVKDGTTLLLDGAPDEVLAAFGGLPEGARLARDPSASADVIVWFVRSAAELGRGIAGRAVRAAGARLWIAWPKKGSGLEQDVGQPEVRRAGLDAGLVDFKVARIDGHWSALAFSVRKPRRTGAGG